MRKPNIILKTFDGHPIDASIPERALRGMAVGTCICIAEHDRFLTKVNADEYEWMPSGTLGMGQYPPVDWNAFAPLDEELIEDMRHCEAVVLRMVDLYTLRMKRYALAGDVPYEERRRQYFTHLRYWNHVLEARQIDLLLMNHAPHQCYDYVLYCLCKRKGIPVLYLDRLFAMDAIFISDDWEEPARDLRDAIRRLREEEKDPRQPVSLSPNYAYYFDHFRQAKPVLWYMGRENIYAQPNFVRKWWRKALKVLRRNPLHFLASITSRHFWSRKLREHRTIRFYERHTRPADLAQPYVYVPLHLQPEATTLPLAGAFEDQERMVQLLAAHLPPGIRLYVKEHPAQGERWRSEAFYRTLLDIHSVTLVPKETDTYALLDRCVAVASATGTVIFEASLRQKPSLMFGHFAWQYGPGVHRIRTSEECRRAMQDIATGKASHTERDVRLYLKAFEQSAVPFPGMPESPVENPTWEEKAEMAGAIFRRHIDRVLAR